MPMISRCRNCCGCANVQTESYGSFSAESGTWSTGTVYPYGSTISTASTGALTVSGTTNPYDPSTLIKVRSSLSYLTDTGKVRIFVLGDSDCSNCYVAELEVIGPVSLPLDHGHSIMRIFERVAGVETLIAECPVWNTVTDFLAVCYDPADGYLRFRCSDIEAATVLERSLEVYRPSASGAYFGLGTGDALSTTVYFYAFAASEYLTENCPSCIAPNCLINQKSAGIGDTDPEWEDSGSPAWAAAGSYRMTLNPVIEAEDSSFLFFSTRPANSADHTTRLCPQWVDANNYLYAENEFILSPISETIRIGEVIAGVDTVLLTSTSGAPLRATWRVGAEIYAEGVSGVLHSATSSGSLGDAQAGAIVVVANGTPVITPYRCHRNYPESRTDCPRCPDGLLIYGFACDGTDLTSVDVEIPAHSGIGAYSANLPRTSFSSSISLGSVYSATVSGRTLTFYWGPKTFGGGGQLRIEEVGGSTYTWTGGWSPTAYDAFSQACITSGGFSLGGSGGTARVFQP